MAQKVENIVFTNGLSIVASSASAKNLKLAVGVAPGANATVAAWWSSAAVGGSNGHLAVTTVGAGDFVLSSGSSSNTLTVAGKSGIAVASTGVADTVCLFSTVDGLVYAFTTCAQQTLGSVANTVTLSSWTITLTN